MLSLLRRGPGRYAAAAVLLLLVVVVAGCTPEHGQSTFDVKGPVARSQLNLFYWIFFAAVFVFVAVEAILIYTVVRYRRKPGQPPPPQTHGNTRLEIGWTVVPALVLMVVAVPTVMTVFYTANPPDGPSIEVDAIAHQWWWEFRYDDPSDPERQVVVANEMHIPVDQIVRVNLESKDVIHSFWVPKLAGKMDMVPNSSNEMWFEAEEPGEYLGQCAEFCGESHAKMRFKVFAQPMEEFNDWLTAQGAPAIDPADPLALEGKALFEGQALCFACHTVGGSDRSRGTKGPDLTHLGSRTQILAGILENTQESLRTWLTEPEAVKAGNIMARDAAVYTDPQKRLTEVQVSSLVAYLRSLK